MDTDPSLDPTIRLRLLESWLPFAQQVMGDLEAHCSPAELEALILAAAPALAMTDSAMTARAVLWSQYLRQRSNH